MQGSENADIWRFERDQYRKQLSEALLRIEELEGQVAGLIEMLGTADFDHFTEWDIPFEGWHVSSVTDPAEICHLQPPCECCRDLMVQGNHRALTALKEAGLVGDSGRYDD